MLGGALRPRGHPRYLAVAASLIDSCRPVLSVFCDDNAPIGQRHRLEYVHLSLMERWTHLAPYLALSAALSLTTCKKDGESQSAKDSPPSSPETTNDPIGAPGNVAEPPADAERTRNRIDTAARATVVVVERLIERHAMALEGTQLIDAFGRTWVMAGVQAIGGRQSTLLVGTAEVRESPEHAAVFAVLDATNRWISARRPR